MGVNYYVQQIAGNYLKNVVNNEETMLKVNPSYFQGLEPEAFTDGFRALSALTRSLYAQIADDPTAFGMLLKENAEDNPKNADYTNSNASFIRVPNTLLLLGYVGELTGDRALTCGGEKLSAAAKALKITGLPFLLMKLSDFGFTWEGLGKTVKPSDRVTASYPDCPALTVALKAMAEAQMAVNGGKLNSSKNFFYMMHAGLLSEEKPKAPKLTAGDVFRTLDASPREAAQKLDAFASREAKTTVRMGGFMRNDWSCVYTGSKSKKVLMTLQTEQDRLFVKLNLQHIGRYINQVNTYPAFITEPVRNGGWECGRCHSSCAGGFAFELDGQAYNKCRCGSFVFESVTPDTIPFFLELLTMELREAAA